ncbi:carboxy terminal-processing peptidase [Pollutibacter soli]|uniref:carboxy terminal-processing peptidase n=1 Tax=Pollutibacter soli TaxID=3034157 RepID=UPI003013D4D1
MFSKKSVPFILVFLFSAILIAFATTRNTGIKGPADKYQKIFTQISEMLEDAHFSPRKIDDQFSKDVFKKYLSSLDPDKNIFVQSDIKELKKYETRIDDELHNAPIAFFYAANEIYQKRIAEAAQIYQPILAQPFNYTVDESVVLDGDKLDYPANEAARKEAWRKRLKYMALDRYSSSIEEREQNASKKDYVAKADSTLEREARKKVTATLDRNFERLRTKFTEEERFNMLVNTITGMMDPHTTFFPPLEKRSFDEQMSGRFFGIGASLRGDDGAIKIATLVTGSPAWKSGQVQVGDQILKVGQGNEEPVDVAGYEVEDAVKLIRGKKGTTVKLTLKKADGAIKVISLDRDEIVLEETFARSVIINEGDKKIGYIFLPEFYADWERPNGARSAKDVENEVKKLKEQNVQGIIMDLRNNGGGSLIDVVQIAGLFIPEGPIVQVKDREGRPTILRDDKKGVLYDGPLAVMVNEFSASASEIFAAAIQDYNRGIIIGSTSTYGKGTVQRNLGLEKTSSFTSGDNSDLGTLKLTLQKFYRVNGGSTQLKGVTPNIVIPDTYEYLKYREKDNPEALPWDEIQKAVYNPVNPGYDLNGIRSSSMDRIKASPTFGAINESLAWLEKNNDREYSLNINKFREEQKKVRAVSKKLDELTKQQKELPVSLLPEDEKYLSADNDKLERRKQWLKSLTKDIYLNETVNVMNDMIKQTSAVAKTN